MPKESAAVRYLSHYTVCYIFWMTNTEKFQRNLPREANNMTCSIWFFEIHLRSLEAMSREVFGFTGAVQSGYSGCETTIFAAHNIVSFLLARL